MYRKTEEILADVKELIHQPGYIYSLCLILFEDFHQDLNKIHQVDYRSKLSIKECSLLIGFLVQRKIDFSFPETPEETFSRKEQSYSLMSELQMSYTAPQMEKLKSMVESRRKGETLPDSDDDKLDFFVKDGGMVEPMFYAGDGVYDFQYLEYLEPKYKYDRQWLSQNKGFDIDYAREIVAAIKKSELAKARKVLPINVKEVFPKVAKEARKSFKKKLPVEKIDEIERQQLIAFSFYRYRELFPSPEDTFNNSDEGWKAFYQNLIDLFVIRPSELSVADEGSLNSFFANFSFKPGGNKQYEGPGYYNILNSCPLIELAEDRYFLPLGYLLPEAVYESPYYWMLADQAYKNEMGKHRGDVGEEIAYELLSQVFGKDNTHRSVLIKNAKGHTLTDIDVLCVLGNKALCVQVKSKKLTLMARRGDFEQLSKDFEGAVQDAYNQGLLSRDAILNQKGRFVNSAGTEVNLPKNVNEAYIMGLTTENFPALVHQVSYMLTKKTDDPFPLFVSAFDLELLVHYLKDPYDFLYYVRQRTALMEYFRADEELIYLGYHLDQKLWKREDADFVALETDFGQNIDRDYYPHKTGVAHLLPEIDNPIHNRWKDTSFDAFITEIKKSGEPKKTDIIFDLLDWSGDARKEIVANMLKAKSKSRNEVQMKRISSPPTGGFGLSYMVTNIIDLAELDYKATNYARMRKYLAKCDTWLGLGAFATSPNLIDKLVYLDDPWQHDAKFERDYADELAQLAKPIMTPMSGKGKIGRNDPCPCRSGKKYKNCCGQGQ
jgi:hypothetical protein